MSRQAGQSQLSDECLITSRRLREFLGDVSEMHIWRLLNDEGYKALKFPRPIKINNRNYFRFVEIKAWIDKQAAKSRREAA